MAWNTLFWGGKLFQQYVVDAWASIEQSKLNWVRFHQKELRVDVYQGLRDAAMGDRNENINLAEHGQRIMLRFHSSIFAISFILAIICFVIFSFIFCYHLYFGTWTILVIFCR